MWLLAEKSPWVFVILTVIIGGGAAWMTGRAMALTWRPLWQVILSMALLGLALRFFHFSLFEETLLSAHYYLVDTTVLILSALLGFRITRTRQMITQYSWLYTPTSLLTWTERKT